MKAIKATLAKRKGKQDEKRRQKVDEKKRQAPNAVTLAEHLNSGLSFLFFTGDAGASYAAFDGVMEHLHACPWGPSGRVPQLTHRRSHWRRVVITAILCLRRNGLPKDLASHIVKVKHECVVLVFGWARSPL